MSQLMEGALEVLKPTYYIPENDEPLKASIRRISAQGALNNRALTVVRVMRTIVHAVFMNIPYYLSVGTANLFFNCVHLNFERMVLGHYKAAMQSLIYSVIAVAYVAIGILIPHILGSFKIEALPFSFKEDSFAPSSLNASGPNRGDETEYSIRSKSISSALSTERSLESAVNLEEDVCELPNIPPFAILLEDSMSISSIETEHSSLSSNQSMDMRERLLSIRDPESGLNSIEGDWVIPNAPPCAIKLVGIHAREMIGDYGINLERHAYRIALNEYIRVLKDDFEINFDDKLAVIGGLLRIPTYKDNPMVIALYRTLIYLKYPVISHTREETPYTNAKQQYEVYLSSLRETLAQYKKIREESSVTGDFKECFALIHALCKAFFLPENHERLRQLLQLHESEYDRLHPEVEEIPVVTRENFAQVVMAKNKKVIEAPPEIKVSGVHRNTRMALGAIGLEDFLMTDIPFLRGKQVFRNEKGKERTFYYMRHPTPHVPNSVLGTALRILSFGYIESGESIAPEFEGMLEAIAERKESYLIQSHQRLNDSYIGENEDGRSQTLYRLQENHKNFHVVFQAVEGELFEHRGPYAEIMTFAGLKEAIKASFYTEGSPNRLPILLEKDELYRQEVIGSLLDQVHQTVFGGRADIFFDGSDPTQPKESYPNCEWQAFILAFYIFQGDDLKFRLPNVKYFCTNCKNFFDRGGNRAMAEDRMHQEMSEREVTREHLEETIVNLVPVPLQSKGKGVIEHRLRPGLALTDILAKLSSKERQTLQRVSFSGYKPDRFEVSKKPQSAIPRIEDAHTFQEIKEVFKALQGKPHCLIDHGIIQKNSEPYQGDRSCLFAQINAKRLDISVDGIRYNAKGIFEHLSKTISKEMALQVMAQIQQGVFLEPLDGLRRAFQHDELDLHVIDAPEKGRTICITTVGDYVEIRAQGYFLYRTINQEDAHFTETPVAIFNTTVVISIPKDGSALHAHWTWEAGEVLM